MREGLNRVAVICCILVLAVVVSVFVYSRIYDAYASQVLQRELDRLLALARDFSQNTETYLVQQHRQMALYCDDNEAIRAAALYDACTDTALLKKALISFVQAADNEAEYAAFVAADGSVPVCYSTSALAPPPDLSGLDLEAFEGMVLTGSAGAFEISPGAYALSLIHGIYENGRYLGALLCMYPLDKLDWSLMRPTYIGSSGYISIIDDRGRVVYHPAQSRIGVNVLQECAAQTDEYWADEQALRTLQFQRTREKVIYRSVWHQDADSPRCIKLTGFSRTAIGEHFLIINVVNRYDDVMRGMEGFVIQAILVSAGVALVLLIGSLSILHIRSRLKLSVRELQYLRDLTLLRDMQSKQNEQIRHQQQVNNIGMFVSGIAHEFNNQLTTILVDAYLLTSSLESNPELRACAEEISEAGIHAKDFVSELLLLSKKEPAREPFEPLVMDDIVRMGERMITRILPHGIDMRIDLRSGASLVLGSERLIRQMLMNLCTNAIQAMKEKTGVITVSTARIGQADMKRLYPMQAIITDYVCLSVEDQGTGMDEQTVSRIFDPFFTTKPGREGTGLGLTMLKNAISSMNGWCDVTSAPGEGSCFRLYFPCHLERSAPACALPHTVFLLSNDANLRRTLEFHLRRIGWTLHAFASHDDMLHEMLIHPGSCAVGIFENHYTACSILSLVRTAKQIEPGLRTVLLTRVREDDASHLNCLQDVDRLEMQPIDWNQLMRWIEQPDSKEETP